MTGTKMASRTPNGVTLQVNPGFLGIDLIRSGSTIAVIAQVTPAWREFCGDVGVSSKVGEHSFVIRYS